LEQLADVPTQAEMLEEVRSLNSTQLDRLRAKSIGSLYFMSKAILGFNDLAPRTHRAFCRFYDRTHDEHGKRINYRMGLMPRGYLKSSIATVADSIRLGAADADNARILISNEIVGNAVDFVSEIRGQWEKNELLRILFGHLVPERLQGPGVQWSQHGVTLVRKTSWKEPTYMPIGVGGAAVSKHFTNIKNDDLIGLEAYNSPAEMKRAIEWTDNVDSLMISEQATTIDWIGTRWRRRDLYRHVLEQYRDSIRVFRRKLIEQGPDGKDFVTFPERISWERVRILRKRPDIFAAQYQNDPLSEEATDFNESDLRFYTWSQDGYLVLGRARWPLEALDKVLLVDPNSGAPTAPDEAAITATGVTPSEDVVVLESYAGRPNPTQFVRQILRMARRWKVRAIGVEQAGQQTTLHYLEREMKETGYYFPVVPLKHFNKEKEVRIRQALSPVLSAQRLWLSRKQPEMTGQIVNFPDLELFDRIDTLGYGPQLWRIPQTLEAHAKHRGAVQKIMASRSRKTGY
jgi:hypothetical protein